MFLYLKKLMANIKKSSFYDVLEELKIDYALYEGQENYLTITSTPEGDVVLVSMQDEEHKILEVLWKK